MNTITIQKTQLKSLIKESVYEVISQELMKIRLLATPTISLKEQKDIEKAYGKPSRKSVKTVAFEI